MKIVKEGDIVWHCFVEVDVPFFKKLFGKSNKEELKKEIVNQLALLISTASHITEVEEP